LLYIKHGRDDWEYRALFYINSKEDLIDKLNTLDTSKINPVSHTNSEIIFLCSGGMPPDREYVEKVIVSDARLKK